MYTIACKNELSREQYRLETTNISAFTALEQNWHSLFLWVLEMLKKAEDSSGNTGLLHPQWSVHPLAVLLDIGAQDLKEAGEKFASCHTKINQNEQIAFWQAKMTAWRDRLDEYSAVHSGWESAKVAEDIALMLEDALTQSGQIVENIQRIAVYEEDGELIDGGTPPQVTQRLQIQIFRLLLISIEKINEKRVSYIERLDQCGDMDPAMAVMVTFLRNYGGLIQQFNARWTRWVDYYLNEILKTRKKKAIEDKTWLSVVRAQDGLPLMLPKGTSFAGGQNKDGTPLIYKSLQEIEVNEWKLEKFVSLSLSSDVPTPVSLLSPSGNEFVTSHTRKFLPLEGDGTPRTLFGREGDGVEPAQSGWMLQSSLLRLKEGSRIVQCLFVLDSDSRQKLKELLDLLSEDSSQGREMKIRFFEKAFQTRLSTEEGWLEIDNRMEYDEEKGCLLMEVRLEPDFAATSPCNKDMHGMETEQPALCAVMNPDAWLFPYSWASELVFERIILRNKVSGMTSLSVRSEQGDADPSSPFFPFGVPPHKGARLLLGCAEIAGKPLSEVRVSCNWQKLPSDPKGFSGYYKAYPGGINNFSYKVVPQWKKNGKWRQGTGGPVNLFSAEGADTPVEEESVISFAIKGDTIPVVVNDEEFFTQTFSNGQLGLLFEEPLEGFGYDTYRDLLSKTLAENAKLETPNPLPPEPVSPMMFNVVLSYDAEEEWVCQQGDLNTNTRFFYLRPFDETQIVPAEPRAVLPLILPSASDSILLFAFSNTLGGSNLRIFTDFTPLQDLPKKDQARAALFALAQETEGIKWAYSSPTGWKDLTPEQIEEDTTNELSSTGVLSILLPEPVTSDCLDQRGFFWMRATVPHPEKCGNILNVFLNAVEVQSEGGDGLSLPAGTITAPEPPVPGVESVIQILDGVGGRAAETEEERGLRIAHRIAHRNRALAPLDCERLILDAFPEIETVRCIPDSVLKDSPRQKAEVRLVLIRSWLRDDYPVCSERVLQAIGEYLRPLMNPFARLSLMNPFYERVTGHCHVELRAGTNSGETIRRLKRKINDFIAPWLKDRKTPYFKDNLSLRELYTLLANDEGVVRLHSVHLLHANGQGQLDIQPPTGEPAPKDKDYLLVPAHDAGLFVPAGDHLIHYHAEGTEPNPDNDSIGIGDLEIAQTFIIL